MLTKPKARAFRRALEATKQCATQRFRKNRSFPSDARKNRPPKVPDANAQASLL